MKIPARFRVALALKALLLISLGIVFLFIAIAALVHEQWDVLIRVPVAFLFGAIGLFPLSFSRWALVDSITGDAIHITGARALRSRKSGVSLKLPDGRHAEYVLFNSWEALQPDQLYSVIIGRRSLVVVAQPELASSQPVSS